MTTPKKKRLDGLATMQTLMDAAISELETHGESGFDMDSVLNQTGVARSSLYHHFDNKAGLIAAAEIEIIRSSMHEENVMQRKMFEQCTSFKELFDIVTLFMRADSPDRGVDVRRSRTRLMTAALQNKNVADAITEAQQSESRYYAESLAIAQNNGVIRKDIDILAVSYWIQGQFFGRILLDLGEENFEIGAQWVETSLIALEAVLSPEHQK
jgi:AcrR family transcriptional regulator